MSDKEVTWGDPVESEEAPTIALNPGDVMIGRLHALRTVGTQYGDSPVGDFYEASVWRKITKKVEEYAEASMFLHRDLHGKLRKVASFCKVRITALSSAGRSRQYEVRVSAADEASPPSVGPVTIDGVADDIAENDIPF